MRNSLFYFYIIVFLFAGSNILAQESFQIYPLDGMFLSPKVKEDKSFLKALSGDGSGNDSSYARSLFMETFKSSFPNVAATVDDKNKYSTFISFLQIPRVSQYRINKPKNLMDLYLPLTMSINFMNMVTGECIYSYSYTYYSKYETFQDQISEEKNQDKDDKITGLYKSTYKDLLQKIVQTAKDNFKPFSIKTVVKKAWNDIFILDKGNKSGITKGDILVDQHSNQLSVIYASSNYSVAQLLIGEVKSDSTFEKFSNDSIDEIKKPKVMLLSNIEMKDIQSVPENIVYQLFAAALNKKASFALVSVDKGFYDAQRATIEKTKLQYAVTQNRELPDYFLKLYFYGPFYSNSPSNKPYMSYDTYAMMACGDFLDNSGRVLYGKCVDEKISDEIYEDVRYEKDARKEVLLKNAAIKLADDFIANIKFKNIELPITNAEKDHVDVYDQLNITLPGENLTLFHNLGKIGGIDEEIYVPTWELMTADKDGTIAVVNKNLPVSSGMPAPSIKDKIILNSMVADNTNGTRVLTMCGKKVEKDVNYTLDDFNKLAYYAISNGIKYPFFDTGDFKENAESFNDSGFGFRKKIDIQQVHSDYCIEPIYKILKQGESTDNGIKSYKFSLTAGLKIYDKDTVIWKKGLQQELSISPPRDFEKSFLDFELTKATFNLLSEIAKKAELNKR